MDGTLSTPNVVDMNTRRHRRAHSLDNQFPRCLAKMANLFDLSAGLTSDKLLADNPHHNGSCLSRSLSDIPMSPSSPSKNRVEDKKTLSQMRRSSSGQKSLGTLMKTLIADEMSKDVEAKHFRSNVVAKLMGLEVLPQKKPHLCDQKGQLRTYPNVSHAPMERAAEFWDKECPFLDMELQNELSKFHQCKDYTDFYEMSQQSDNPNTARQQPPQKGRRGRIKHEKKMALVRQKFMEAKRLVTDEKLRHTKEFQDALAVLSSNRELFLSFLQEPNALFSGDLCELQSLPCETKRITILRPSKMVDHEKFSMPGGQNDKLMNQPPLVAELTRLDVDNADGVYDCSNEDSKDCPSHLTRIVLLKPSSGKNGEMKTSSSPCCEDANRDEKLESSDITGEIPCQVQENLVSGRRDGTLLSSVYSNGHTGNDSSFYKSEGEEAIGNLSDSEVMSPPSKHSWDFVDKVGCPYSLSSFSCASYSPESSVCREAKRRLSERWALMASHQTYHERRHVHKDSSTLGEMLALLDTNKKLVRPEKSASGKEQQLIGSPWSISDSNREEPLADSPKCLMRSKSLPVSSSAYSDNLNVEEADPQMGKSGAQEAAAKRGNVKPSSFKGKVSSLFSFMSRKSRKEISGKPQPKDRIQPATVDSPDDLMEAKNCDVTSAIDNDNGLRALCSSPSQILSLPEDADGHRSRGTVANEAGLSDSKSDFPDSKQNQDHLSPISVLDPSFDEDASLTSESSAGEQGPVLPLRFNIIDKSPPIGSIARTLSWDDTIKEASAPYFSKSSNVSPVMEEELDWLAFVQTLLSEAGLDGQLSLDTFISRWYSSESPLDPSLREKFANVNDKGTIMPEVKRRQRRSDRKLAYDCVNIALVKATGCCGSNWCLLNGSYVEARDGAGPTTLSTIMDRVWAQMKEWFSDEVRCEYKCDGDSGSSNSLVVKKVVRNEVVGKGWVDHLAIDMDCLGKDIELRLLDELVDEAVTDLTVWHCLSFS